MAYEFLQEADVSALIDSNTFDTVTEGDVANAELMEQTAIEKMFAYLDVRYDATAVFAAVDPDRNASVVTYCVDIMLYHLHAKVMPDNIPELRNTRYTDAIGWLEKVADGFINPRLPIEEDAPRNQLRFGSTSESANQQF